MCVHYGVCALWGLVCGVHVCVWGVVCMCMWCVYAVLCVHIFVGRGCMLTFLLCCSGPQGLISKSGLNPK